MDADAMKSLETLKQEFKKLSAEYDTKVQEKVYWLIIFLRIYLMSRFRALVVVQTPI